MSASTGTYAGGFAQGERDAFKDRRRNVVRELRADPETEEERGYWDAYSPRSATLGARQRSPARRRQTAQVPA